MEGYQHIKIRELLQSDLVTEATQNVMLARLNEEEADKPDFFDENDYRTLKAVCVVLSPSEIVPAFFVPTEIDKRLAKGKGNGWRYAVMPPDGETYHRGLQMLDESAKERFGFNFASIDTKQQIEILEAVRSGKSGMDAEHDFNLSLFLEELITEFAEIFYSHPLAQEEIDYAGFADAKGWQKIGLNQKDTFKVQSSKPKNQGKSIVSSNKNLSIRRYSTSEVVDAVVIGTGAGGAPVMARLAKVGLKVVALEAGKDWQAAKDFATDEREQNKLYWQEERLSAGKNSLSFGRNNSGIGVGGSTLHYTAFVPRPHPDDFKLYSDFGVGANWPLSYIDLEPYFEELEMFLGVSGPSFYPWNQNRKTPYPFPPLPLNAAAQFMQGGAARVGIKTSPAPNAAVSQPHFQQHYGWRPSCSNRGFCEAGCTTGAKASMDVTFIPDAVYHGAEVRPECFAVRLEVNASGKIDGVVYIHEGIEHKQRCKAVFLCAGAVETPRLLLMNELANSSGQVGKNFMAHVSLQVWGQFQEATHPYKGIPAALISEDMHRPGNAGFAGGYLMESIGILPVTYASQLARARGVWGEKMKEKMDSYNHTAGINMHGDCLPYQNNYMELSDEVDKWGIPKPIIHFSNGENEASIEEHGRNRMREIWEAAGAFNIWEYPRNSHTLGTCRMGRNRNEAVINGYGQSFDVPNLYICDGSVFTTSLSVNPSLTIMAVALRNADNFLQKLKRKEI